MSLHRPRSRPERILPDRSQNWRSLRGSPSGAGDLKPHGCGRPGPQPPLLRHFLDEVEPVAAVDPVWIAWLGRESRSGVPDFDVNRVLLEVGMDGDRRGVVHVGMNHRVGDDLGDQQRQRGDGAGGELLLLAEAVDRRSSQCGSLRGALEVDLKNRSTVSSSSLTRFGHHVRSSSNGSATSAPVARSTSVAASCRGAISRSFQPCCRELSYSSISRRSPEESMNERSRRSSVTSPVPVFSCWPTCSESWVTLPISSSPAMDRVAADPSVRWLISNLP